MSELRILIVAPTSDAEDSEAKLDMLRAVNLHGALKYLVTYGKLDTAGAAKTFNVESGYPEEPPLLQTLSAWAEPESPVDDRLSDGFDLYCLLRILDKLDVAISYAIILRDGVGFEQNWPALQAAVGGRQFITFEGGVPPSTENGRNVLFDLTDLRTRALLDLTWELYATGGAYALSPYSLDLALTAAATSQALLESGQMPSINSRQHDV